MQPVRRVKTYSGQSGYVYQYVFIEQRRARRGWLTRGAEYVFDVSSDRKSSFLLPVFVADEALASWRKAHGRELSSTEQYAAAKMRLFRAFDEAGNLGGDAAGVAVDSTNIEELLAALDIA